MSHPARIIYEPLLRRALDEDLGRGGDLTTDSVVPDDAMARAVIVAREAGTIAGIEMAAAVFGLLDPDVEVAVEVRDGTDVAAGTVLATVSGPARPILTGERTALNLLGRLSGIATATRAAVAAAEGTGARVADTRKTTPGLRALEKYAVRCGGGMNHRFGLDDAVLIKDNHLAVAGSITEAVGRARAAVGHTVKIEVEVDDFVQLQEALDAGAELILLDNMSPEDLAKAVDLVGGRARTEASGGINPDTVAAVARSGVDLLSMGALTHSSPALDVALDFEVL